MDGDSDRTIDSDELEELKQSQNKSGSSLGSSRIFTSKGLKKNPSQNCVSESDSSDTDLEKNLGQSKSIKKDSDTDQTIDSDELEDYIAHSQKNTQRVSGVVQKRTIKENSDKELNEKAAVSMSDKPAKRSVPMQSLGLWSDSDSEKDVKEKKVNKRPPRKMSRPKREEVSDSDSGNEEIVNNKTQDAVLGKSQSGQLKSLGLWSDSENEEEDEKNGKPTTTNGNPKYRDDPDLGMDYEATKSKTGNSSRCPNSSKNSPSTSKVPSSKKSNQNNLNKKPRYKEISDSDSDDKIINTEKVLGKRTHSKYKEISDSDSESEVEKKRKKANIPLSSHSNTKGKKVSKNIFSESSHSKYQELSDSDNEAVQNDVDTSTMSNTGRKREKCRYGKNCYRKNTDHIKNFDHGSDTDETGKKNSSSKQKISNENMKKNQFKSKAESSKEKNVSGNTENSSGSKSFEFYLTKVNGIPQKYNSLAYDIKDLLSFKDVTLISSAQFNYMFDVPWLIRQYPENYRKCPLTIVHGEERQSKAELEKVCSAYPNIKLCQAKLDIPFGTHHTKMMFLLYKEGFRIVIHTSNIVDSDWDQRTQGMWISPLLPELKNPSATEGESPTNFKADLLEYVTAYKASELNEWLQVIEKHNFSSVRVVLIGSVPGRFVGSRKTAFGHLKLRKVLNLHGSSMNLVPSTWPLVCQFSSIGSLGSKPDQWMTSELCSSLSTVNGSSLSYQTNMKLVFPTVENVRKSLQGYPAGASLPYSIKVAQKQTYLRDFMHQWKSDKLGRSEASPHIKTYLRLSPDNCNIAWFLLTSANLSKAAWGSLEKKGSQFMIRSYELGVLFLPKFFELELFSTPFSSPISNAEVFPIPYDIPLQPYSKDDETWIWDIPHVHAPDRHGMKWCPPGLK